MRPKICEIHGCRKHVTHMIAVKILFATQVTGKGEVPIYRERHLFRCTAHVEPGEVTLTIAEYDALVKAKEQS